MGSKAIVTLLSLGTLGLGVGLPARAAQPVALNIKAQPLETALSEFARQSGMQLLFASTNTLNADVAPELTGTFKVDDGLRKLLESSNLSYQYVNEKTIAIRDRASTADGPIRLAQAEESASNADADATDGSGVVGANRALPEVLVKGTKSLDADIARSRDDIQPYTVLGREAIERSGAATIDQLLRKELPANAQPISVAQTGGVQGDVSTIDLRGLGSAQTLILVDGRKVASYVTSGNVTQPDLNGIPLSAIERIEILPVSASAIYGGSATGGVVNVVLRRDYVGSEIGVTYDNTFDTSAANYRVDLNGGYSLNDGKTSLLFSAGYSDQDPLLVKERDFVEQGRATILANNPSTYLSSSPPPLGGTSNIRSSTGANLTLKNGTPLGSPIAYVPYGYSGRASDGGLAFRQTAGTYNFDLADSAQSTGGGNQSLLTASSISTLRTSLRHNFSDRFTAFIELSGSRNSGKYFGNSVVSTFNISQNAPNNPFNQDIVVTTPTIGADRAQSSRLDDKKVVLGAVAHLNGTWSTGLDFTFDRTTLRYSSPAFGIQASGTAAITSGSADILRDTNAFPVNFGSYALVDSELDPVRTTFKDAALRVGGAVWTIPGGPIDLSLQLEKTWQDLDDYVLNIPSSNFVSLFPSRSQTVESIYAEFRVPIVTEVNRRVGVKLLDLQVAGRFDDYKSVGAGVVSIVNGVSNRAVIRETNSFNSTVPTVGMRYAPTSDIMFRGSFGRGFLPPNLSQLVPLPESRRPTGIPTLRDPRRGNTPVTSSLTVLLGGNPDLDPETSSTKTFGMVFTPRFSPGLRVSVDWARTEKRNNIRALPLIQSTLDNELLVPNLITRAPAQNDGYSVGPISVIDTRFLNVNRAAVESYDWSIDYTFTTQALGEFFLGARATQYIHNQAQLTPATPFLENAGYGLAPRWAGTTSLNWKFNAWTLGWAAQYLDSYWYNTTRAVDINQGAASAPNVVYHDFSGAYRFARGGSGPTAGLELSFGVRNVFNRSPRVLVVSNSGNLYDSRTDPRLATYYLSVRKAF